MVESAGTDPNLDNSNQLRLSQNVHSQKGLRRRRAERSLAGATTTAGRAAGGRGRGFRCGSGDFDERGLRERERERASERGSGAERSLKNCSVSLSPTGSATTAPTHSTAAAGRGTETLEDDDPSSRSTPPTPKTTTAQQPRGGRKVSFVWFSTEIG